MTHEKWRQLHSAVGKEKSVSLCLKVEVFTIRRYLDSLKRRKIKAGEKGGGKRGRESQDRGMTIIPPRPPKATALLEVDESTMRVNAKKPGEERVTESSGLRLLLFKSRIAMDE